MILYRRAGFLPPKQAESINTLLHDFHTSVYVRNGKGETPRCVAGQTARKIFDEYMAEHKNTLEEGYKTSQKLAFTRYSGSHCVTRVFVVGHPGAGKSSSIEEERFHAVA